MNNRSLVNLKAIMPNTGTAIVSLTTRLSPDKMKPIGWHSYCRACIAQRVLVVKSLEAEGRPAREEVKGLMQLFRIRHCPPKGWHI